jgi:hypothetical protein
MTDTPMRIAYLLCSLLLLPVVSLAQTPEPIGPVAVDARVALPRFKENADVASALGVSTTNMPGRGLGLAGGVHWYPVRMGRVTLGLGGEILFSGASNTLEAEDDTGVDGPTVHTHFSTVSPQVSLNFGTGKGWSYLSGGLGWGSFTTEREDDPVAEADGSIKVLNYGGGARWFAKDHLAFTFDLRFYAINGQEASTARPAYPKVTLMIISAGVSFK